MDELKEPWWAGRGLPEREQGEEPLFHHRQPLEATSGFLLAIYLGATVWALVWDHGGDRWAAAAVGAGLFLFFLALVLSPVSRDLMRVEVWPEGLRVDGWWVPAGVISDVRLIPTSEIWEHLPYGAAVFTSPRRRDYGWSWYRVRGASGHPDPAVTFLVHQPDGSTKRWLLQIAPEPCQQLADRLTEIAGAEPVANRILYSSHVRRRPVWMWTTDVPGGLLAVGAVAASGPAGLLGGMLAFGLWRSFVGGVLLRGLHHRTLVELHPDGFHLSTEQAIPIERVVGAERLPHDEPMPPGATPLDMFPRPRVFRHRHRHTHDTLLVALVDGRLLWLQVPVEAAAELGAAINGLTGHVPAPDRHPDPAIRIPD